MTYYRMELGHILHVLPDDVGELTPGEMVEAQLMFDSLYRNG